MDETRIHNLARKTGGRFRLASLVQKRMLQLNRGQRQLTERDNRNPLYTVLQEIAEGKVGLLLPAEEQPGEPGSITSLETGGDEFASL